MGSLYQNERYRTTNKPPLWVKLSNPHETSKSHIVKPLLMGKKDRREEEGYPRKLIKAVQEDASLKRPNFYALVIEGY